MTTPRVVGWLLHRDNICEKCNERPAERMVTYNGIDSSEVCRKCLPSDCHDEIANVFHRIESE